MHRKESAGRIIELELNRKGVEHEVVLLEAGSENACTHTGASSKMSARLQKPLAASMDRRTATCPAA